MVDEVGTKITSPEAPGPADSLFDDAADVTSASILEANGSEVESAAGQQDIGNAEKQVPGNKAEQGPQGSDDGGNDIFPSDDLKVVVSVKGGRATIGVQRPSADPHIETFDDLDETGLTKEVPAVIDMARTRWEDNPKHPAYARPVPVRSRSRRGQGAAQATTAEGEEAQQASLGLF